MTVCELAFIPNKSLRACSVVATWIRVFSHNPSESSISAARPDVQHARLAGKTQPEVYLWAPRQIPQEAPTSPSESGPSLRANTSPSLKFPNYLRHDSAVLRRPSFLTLCTMNSGWEPSAQVFIRCLRSARFPATGSLIGCACWDVTSKTFPDCRFFCLQSARCCSIPLWSMLMRGFLGSETVPAALPRLRLHLWHSSCKPSVPGDFVSSPESPIEASCTQGLDAKMLWLSPI